MKKAMMLLGLALVSVAGAKSWDVEDLGKLSLVGFYGKQDGVYCDFSFVLTKKQTARINWNQRAFKVFTQNGTSQEADSVAFIDDKFAGEYNYTTTHEIIANVPVKVTAYFNIPSSTPSFRALAYKDVKFDNVPIRPYGSTLKTPAPLPVTGVSGFSIALSNCQLQSQNYVCTAVLTPTK